MRTAIVLFNRDLRVHDHAALRAGAEYDAVLPLFVIDPAINPPRNRMAFLVDCLRDLDLSLTRLGAPLVIRRGRPADVIAELRRTHAITAVLASADYTPIARRREDALEPTTFSGVALVAPGEVTPTSGDHYKVFTSYWHRWRERAAARPVLAAPSALRGVTGISSEALPTLSPSAPASVITRR